MMQPMGGSMPMMQPMGVPGAPIFPPASHGQMMFTASQRPQPKMGQQTHMYNILPMISFKVRFHLTDAA